MEDDGMWSDACDFIGGVLDVRLFRALFGFTPRKGRKGKVSDLKVGPKRVNSKRK